MNNYKHPMFVGNKNRQICITVSCLISSLQITAIRSCSSQREKGALVTTASAIVLDSVRTVVFAGLVHVQLIQQHRAERSEVETVRDNEALFVVHGGTSPVIFVNEKHEMKGSGWFWGCFPVFRPSQGDGEGPQIAATGVE